MAIAALALVLAGCQSIEVDKPQPADARIQVPSGWSAREAAGPVGTAWLEELADPKLRALVEEAIENNFELQAAAARVEEASAQATLEAASEQPTLNAAAAASRRGSQTNATRRSTSNAFNAQLDVAWETDLWGRLADASEAARLDARAVVADYRAARLSLAANVAQSWYDALAASLQVELAEDTLENFLSNLEIVEEGFRSGLNSALDVRLERANIAGARARLEARKIDRDRSARVLEILLGRYPRGALELSGDFPSNGYALHSS